MTTLEDKRDEFLHLKNNVYPNLRRRQKEHEDLYWQKTDLMLDPAFFGSPIWAPTAMRIVEAPADHIAMDNIVVTYTPRSGARGQETETSRKEADMIEKWLQCLVDLQRRQEPYFLRELIKNFSWWGEGFLKISVDEEVIKDPEHYEGNPFTLSVPSSCLIYTSLELDEAVPVSIFEEKVVTLRHVKRRLREWNKDEGRINQVLLGLENLKLQDSDLISFVEWWTPEERGYLLCDYIHERYEAIPIADEFIVSNTLGFVPYCRGFGGRGIWPSDGEPASLVVGLLTGVERVVMQEARLMTQINTITSKLVMPYVIATLAPGKETLSEAEKVLKPGVILMKTVEGVTDWEIVNPPPIPPSLIQELQVVRGTLDGYLPPITRGEGTPGEPASSSASRLATAFLIWEPQLISARKLISRALGLCLQTVEKVIKHPVTIGGIALSPDKLSGHYPVSIRFDPGNPEQRRWDLLIGKDMIGELPQRMRIERFYHEPNATQVQIDLLAEELFRNLMLTNPTFQLALTRRIFAKVGLTEELKELPAGPISPGPTSPGPIMPEGTAPEGLEGIGGSPTRGVPALAGMRAPMSRDMERLRAVEEALRG